MVTFSSRMRQPGTHPPWCWNMSRGGRTFPSYTHLQTHTGTPSQPGYRGNSYSIQQTILHKYGCAPNDISALFLPLQLNKCVFYLKQFYIRSNLRRSRPEKMIKTQFWTSAIFPYGIVFFGASVSASLVLTFCTVVYNPWKAWKSFETIWKNRKTHWKKTEIRKKTPLETSSEKKKNMKKLKGRLGEGVFFKGKTQNKNWSEKKNEQKKPPWAKKTWKKNEKTFEKPFFFWIQTWTSSSPLPLLSKIPPSSQKSPPPPKKKNLPEKTPSSKKTLTKKAFSTIPSSRKRNFKKKKKHGKTNKKTWTKKILKKIEKQKLEKTFFTLRNYYFLKKGWKPCKNNKSFKNPSLWKPSFKKKKNLLKKKNLSKTSFSKKNNLSKYPLLSPKNLQNPLPFNPPSFTPHHSSPSRSSQGTPLQPRTTSSFLSPSLSSNQETLSLLPLPPWTKTLPSSSLTRAPPPPPWAVLYGR